MLTSLSFSQTSTTNNDVFGSNEYPIILKQGDKTIVCFSLEQARQIAKDKVALKADEEIIIQYEDKEKITREIIKGQEVIIENLNKEILEYKAKDENNIMLNKNKDQEIQNLNQMVKNTKKTNLKLRIATFTGFSLAVVLPIGALYIKSIIDKK